MSVSFYDPDSSRRLQREEIQKRWHALYRPVRHLDPMLILAALGLTAIGIVMIYSAKFDALRIQDLPSTFYISKQLLAAGIGVVGMALMAALDYRWLRSYSPFVYALAGILLLLVLTPLGVEVNGAQGWFRVAGFQFQPAEFAKLAVIAALAALLHDHRSDDGLGPVVLALVLAGMPAALVFVQPDLGTAIVFVWILFVMLLVAGIRVRYLVGLSVLGVAGVVGALRLQWVQDYQLNRITSFLSAGDPSLARGAGYNLEQSLIAVGSGQFTGKGLFNGTQTSLSFVPENHTDFIFTVIGEELGFLGAAVVLGLFGILLWRGIRIAMMANDDFGTLLASGIVAVLVLQLFVNVGMTIGIMPVTGLPLPFLSYGGTSLILSFLFVGGLLSIHMRRF